MSNDLKIKDINNKLEAKLQTSSWSDLLIPYISGTAHYQFMDHILNDMKDGVKFTPALKDWFTEFFRVNLENLKLVVVTHDYRPLPFELDEGTFRLVTNRTASEITQGSHGSYWNIFNEVFFEFLEENNKKVPVVFINPMTYLYGKNINPDTKKFFLPELESMFWKDKANIEKVKNNANILLKSQGSSQLIW